jgi:hypothetical protein
MGEAQSTSRKCPTCKALYLVRVDPRGATADREVICVSCGGPLIARENGQSLIYFYGDPAKTLRAIGTRPRRQSKGSLLERLEATGRRF